MKKEDIKIGKKYQYAGGYPDVIEIVCITDNRIFYKSVGYKEREVFSISSENFLKTFAPTAGYITHWEHYQKNNEKI